LGADSKFVIVPLVRHSATAGAAVVASGSDGTDALGAAKLKTLVMSPTAFRRHAERPGRLVV
jgi:hypothetical protein